MYCVLFLIFSLRSILLSRREKRREKEKRKRERNRKRMKFRKEKREKEKEEKQRREREKKPDFHLVVGVFVDEIKEHSKEFESFCVPLRPRRKREMEKQKDKKGLRE